MRSSEMRAGIAVLACAAALLVQPAVAQVSLLAEGRAIALARCGICHATAAGIESPHRSAPPFASLHASYPIAMLEEAKRTGVISGHDEMPMFELTMRETSALLTYIDDLAPLRRSYMTPGR